MLNIQIRSIYSSNGFFIDPPIMANIIYCVAAMVVEKHITYNGYGKLRGGLYRKCCLCDF